jgi:hypothetical protein
MWRPTCQSEPENLVRIRLLTATLHSTITQSKSRSTANKEQKKGRAKTNHPKLTAKQKKEKKAKKALGDRLK